MINDPGHIITGSIVLQNSGYLAELNAKPVNVPVELRNKNTLLPIVEEWILPGMRIMSNYYKAYDCLKDERYVYFKVNHSIVNEIMTGAIVLKDSGYSA